MRKAILILSLLTGLLAIISLKPSNENNSSVSAYEGPSHWGYVYFDISGTPNAKNYIGKGGFKDEASCLSEANKRLNAHPDITHLEARCLENFELFERPIIMA